MMLLKNAKGQIAIFVVLIFQVLFILFAMSINVALVVHDKINLQNSLDLAAYYGAKQQAEVLNAMAHINYQMRQNWKLLAWRYRILGTLAQDVGGDQTYWCPGGASGIPCLPRSETAGVCGASFYPNSYCDTQYFVCLSNSTWRRGVGGGEGNDAQQNLCTKQGVTIPPITPFGSLPAPHLPFVQMAQQAAIQLQREVSQSCPEEGALNWYMTQMFLSHFRLDQKDRRVMMKQIYDKTLKVGLDLDGKSVLEGARKVFYNNLTYANKKSVDDAGGVDAVLDRDFYSFRNKPFEEVFGILAVAPVLQFLYVGGNNANVTTCPVEARPHNLPNPDSEPALQDMMRKMQGHNLYSYLSFANYLFQFNVGQNAFQESVGDDPIRSLALGFYKKNDKELYYGLKVVLDYVSKYQVFSLPLGSDIVFKASSFAKAFGGRFGPQPGDNDPLIPINHPEGRNRISPALKGNPVFLQPNYSRWPGDEWGLLDRNLHDNNVSSNFLNKHKAWSGQRAYTIEAFFHLIFYDGSFDDPLAYLEGAGPNHFLRMMELMAVYPDVYDTYHYSISGNYMGTYFPKICRLLVGSDCGESKRYPIESFAQDYKAYIRGDLGWPYPFYRNENRQRGLDISVAPYFLKRGTSSVIDASKIYVPPEPTENPPSSPVTLPPILGNSLVSPQALTQGQLFYPWLVDLPGGLLSSWTPNLSREVYQKGYTLEGSAFLRCGKLSDENKGRVSDPQKAIPSSCFLGGRSGYSVKLISCDVARDNKERGRFAPEPLEEYCP